MSVVNRFPFQLEQVDNAIIFNDFLYDQVDTEFVDTVTDSGTVAIGDARNGIAALEASDATVADNDEAYLRSANETLLFLNGKPIYAACYLQFTEASTSAANVFFGIGDAIGAANTLVDNGAGMKVSFSGAAIYKVDGGLVWKCVSSNSTTQTVSTSTCSSVSTAYQKLEIICEDDLSTRTKITFKCNGDFLRDSNNLIITHYVLYASATEMAVGVGVKNGASAAETLNLDWILAEQVR